MILTSSIFAVALSLASTNDYVYFTTFPTNADIRGIGTGKELMYSSPRLEDIAFLNEAWTERYHALGIDAVLTTNANVSHYTTFPSKLAFVPFEMTVTNSIDNTVYKMFAESFDPTNKWFVKRGFFSSFVDPSFDLAIDQSGQFASCENDWTVYVSGQKQSVRNGYVYLLANYDRITPPRLALTHLDERSRMFSIGKIASLYTNLENTATMVSVDSSMESIATKRFSNIAIYPAKQEVRLNAVNRFATYSKETYEVDGHAFSQRTGYTLQTVTDTPPVTTISFEGYPLERSVFEYTKATSTPFSARVSGYDSDNDEYSWKSVNVMPSYVRTESRQWWHPRWDLDMRLLFWCRNIDRNTRLTDLKIRIAVGLTLKVEDAKTWQNYDTTTSTVDVVTNSYFTVRQVRSPEQIDVIEVDGVMRPLFNSSIHMADVIDELIRFAGEPDYMTFQESAIYADTLTIPTSGRSKGRYPDSSLSATRKITRTVSVEWIKVYFIFNPVYRAKTIGGEN